MPSKKSKSSKTAKTDYRSNPARDFSEPELLAWGAELGEKLKPGTKILLEGPLGAGKSTLAQAILRGLGVDRPPEGSPTFALAHEYRSKRGDRVVHVDLYRLKSEAELEDAGLLETLWDPEVTAICEWTSKFPEVEENLRKSGFPLIEIELSHLPEPDRRRLSVSGQAAF